MNTIESWIIDSKGRRKFLSGLLCLSVLCLIGLIDYWADYRLLFTVLYVLPIGFATIYVGRIFAVFLALLSVALWNAGDILAHAPSPGLAIQFWNDGIVLSLFLIVIYLLNSLHKTLIGLEDTVRDRTRALRLEMEERQRLEREALDLSERERQTLGHELHDTVCQELAGIAIAGHLLAKKLQAQNITETGQAREIAVMVDRALTKARSLARGFFTTGFDVMGLAEALQEAARNVEERSGIRCEVNWQENLVILNEDVVMHFFRIAQEALQNAVNHAGPSLIEVNLRRVGETVQLAVQDNGRGLSPSEKPARGLGLRIMAYRAAIIGGELKIERPARGGTRILCIIPIEKISRESALSGRSG
jgi:signal transduction histidine kinase